MTQPPPPPGWYPDPAGSAGTRWWDGHGWTDHVQQATPAPPSTPTPPPPPPPSATPPPPPAPAGHPGGPSLYEQPVLVVS
ncbi:MAG: DUF2510 domain-containing protein, partial [Blastococcus sp.]